MTKHITLISNVCFEPYWRTFIGSQFSCASIIAAINVIEYNEYKKSSDTIKNSDIIVVCLSFEEIYADLANDISSGKFTYEMVEIDASNKCKELYTYVKQNSNAKIIWFGFEDYYCLQSGYCGSVLVFDGLIDRLNIILYSMLGKDIFIDFKRLIAALGTKKAYDIKRKYRWNAPYSKELISIMADEILRQYLIITGNTKKCLVLDCDNVLWGGILSEDGIDGIKIGNSGLGRSFLDFQRYLLDLYYHGIILAICSKNDEISILQVFREHSGMLLKEEHISCFSCNWDNKSNNIKNISDTLNIGLDSVVFVDDSKFEVELVKSMLPDVRTILYQKETVYDELSCFNLKRYIDIKAVNKRTDTYKTNKLRDQLKQHSSSYDDYISSLEMSIDINRATNSEISRCSELTQRTNKCTNGVRYTLDELRSIISLTDYELYTVYLSDRFSDLGLVGVMGLKGGMLDLFSLSCRALGRKVEEKMIEFAIKRQVGSALFCSTKQNDGIALLLKSHGLL